MRVCGIALPKSSRGCATPNHTQQRLTIYPALSRGKFEGTLTFFVRRGGFLRWFVWWQLYFGIDGSEVVTCR